MALGKPVVAWKVGGVPELVRDGVDGRVVPFGRDSRFVEAVRQLLADEGMARRCGAEAAERVSKHFTYRRMVNKTLAFHRELLQRGRIGRE
jgi:glycosyltransferase involved in cell wall biosynthesis